MLSWIYLLVALALRILQNDYDSSFNIILEKSDTVTIHIKNLQKLMLESLSQ